MSLIIKLDEDLSASVAAPLLDSGYVVRTVHSQGWGGMKDPQLWPMVCAEGAFWITADKGFGDLRYYAPGTHPGILVLRPDKESIAEYSRLLERVLLVHPLKSLAGAVSVATPRGLRIRRTPLP